MDPWWYPFVAGWFRENPKQKWMMNRGAPHDFGSLLIWAIGISLVDEKKTWASLVVLNLPKSTGSKIPSPTETY